jgi:ATP-binding protein involved in chromosome partitioning
MKEVDGKGLIVPIEKFGIKMMSIGLLIDEKQAVVWRGPMVSSAIKQFVSDVDWGELDYLVIDMPPGTGRYTFNHCTDRTSYRCNCGDHPSTSCVS